MLIFPNCDKCLNNGKFTYEDFINHEGECYYCTENKYNFTPKIIVQEKR